MGNPAFEDFSREELEEFAENCFFRCGYYHGLIQKCASCKAKLKKDLGGK